MNNSKIIVSILVISSLFLAGSFAFALLSLEKDSYSLEGGNLLTANAGSAVLAYGGCGYDCYELACWNDDVYWFDSWGYMGEKYEECGSDSWTENYRCSGNYVQREKIDRGCSGGYCFEYNAWENQTNCSNYNKECRQGECVELYDDLDVDCYASPSRADEGERVVFRSNVSGGTGYYDYDWSGDCHSNSSTCDETYYTDGTKRTTLRVTSGNQTESASCSVHIEEEEEEYFCWNGDVYTYRTVYGDHYDWYGYGWDYEEEERVKHEECGSDYCGSWSSDYCYRGDVYKRRTCYEKGCEDGDCHSESRTDRDLVERCDSDEVCDDGRCEEDRECSSGPCCEDGEYESSSTICDVDSQTQYGCPWGSSCGSNVGMRKRSRVRYCSGDNSSCNGEWGSWTSYANWEVADICSASETCSFGASSCLYSSACTGTTNYTSCFEGDVFLYNSAGVRQYKYKECDDENACTEDSCQGNTCVNEMKCDGSTCEIGSSDYCENCETCGDQECNCEETQCTCPEDCSAVVISALGKISGTDAWEAALASDTGEDVEFIFLVTNSGPETAEDVLVTAEMPEGVTYKNELKIDGEDSKDDLRDGVVLSSLEPNTSITFTFNGRLEGEAGGEKEVKAKVEVAGLSATDLVEINLGERGDAGLASAGSILLNFLAETWYIIILAGLAIFSIVWVLRKGS